MARLICPAVLCFHYKSGNINHDLMLAFALSTNGRTQVVALQMYGWEPQWSGWHGSWQFICNAFHIWIHFAGDESRLVAKRVLLAVPHGSFGDAGAPQPAFCGFMWDRNADVHMSFSIKTFLFDAKQLEYDEWQLVEKPLVKKPS